MLLCGSVRVNNGIRGKPPRSRVETGSSSSSEVNIQIRSLRIFLIPLETRVHQLNFHATCDHKHVHVSGKFLPTHEELQTDLIRKSLRLIDVLTTAIIFSLAKPRKNNQQQGNFADFRWNCGQSCPFADTAGSILEAFFFPSTRR